MTLVFEPQSQLPFLFSTSGMAISDEVTSLRQNPQVNRRSWCGCSSHWNHCAGHMARAWPTKRAVPHDTSAFSTCSHAEDWWHEETVRDLYPEHRTPTRREVLHASVRSCDGWHCVQCVYTNRTPPHHHTHTKTTATRPNQHPRNTPTRNPRITPPRNR